MSCPVFHIVVCYPDEPEDIYVAADSFASAKNWYRLAVAAHPDAHVEIRKRVRGHWSRLHVEVAA